MAQSHVIIRLLRVTQYLNTPSGNDVYFNCKSLAASAAGSADSHTAFKIASQFDSRCFQLRRRFPYKPAVMGFVCLLYFIVAFVVTSVGVSAAV
jgi:hypothetical protein